jgi:hypothetical protein
MPDFGAQRVLLDRRGQPLFLCSVCHGPLTTADFAQLRLRLPDPDETAGEYLDAELIDGLAHYDCTHAARAAS